MIETIQVQLVRVKSSEKSMYLIVGFITYVTDILLSVVFVNFLLLDYVSASVLGFIASTMVSYLLTVQYVFVGSKVKKRYTLPLYVITTALGIVITKFVLELLTEDLGLHYLISKNVAILFIIVFNYFVRKFLIFRK